MNDSKGRTWELKCLVVLYLIPAAAGLQRAVSSIQTWSFLGKLLPFSPLYLLISGMAWFILGIISACWLWFNLKHIYLVLIISTLIIAAWYWFERLFLIRNEPVQANLLFAVVTTLLSLVFMLTVIFLPAQRSRFSQRK